MAKSGSLAGASRRCVTSSALSDKEDDEEDDESAFVHPRFHGRNLIITFPLLCLITCLVGNYKVKFKGEDYRTVVNSLTRHMKTIHKVEFDRVNWCSMCNINIGRMVANHGCFKKRKIFVVSKKDDE